MVFVSPPWCVCLNACARSAPLANPLTRSGVSRTIIRPQTLAVGLPPLRYVRAFRLRVPGAAQPGGRTGRRPSRHGSCRARNRSVETGLRPRRPQTPGQASPVPLRLHSRTPLHCSSRRPPSRAPAFLPLRYAAGPAAISALPRSVRSPDHQRLLVCPAANALNEPMSAGRDSAVCLCTLCGVHASRRRLAQKKDFGPPLADSLRPASCAGVASMLGAQRPSTNPLHLLVVRHAPASGHPRSSPLRSATGPAAISALPRSVASLTHHRD